jgi:sugar/nucleoside kinase (ribokinase family)
VARYLTVGNLLVENIVMPDGRELRDRLGGDAIYAAAGARAFADDVLPVVRLGQGFPDALVGALEEAGYADALLPSEHPAVRLRVDWGVEDGSRFTFEPGSGTYLQATPLPEELPDHLADGLEAVHVAPIPFAQMAAWIEWARPRARVLTVDPHYQHVDADWARILPHVDAFLPSRDEASGILGGWPGAEAAVRALTNLGARTVCIKLGSAGAIGASETHVVRAPAATGRVVDATGCGDAFCGGFLVGLTESADLPAALAYGSAAASFAAEDHGAAHALEPDRNEAHRRLHG